MKSSIAFHRITDAPGATLEEFGRILLEKISSNAEIFPRHYGAPVAMTPYYQKRASGNTEESHPHPRRRADCALLLIRVLETLITPMRVPIIGRNETQEESAGFFESGLAQGGAIIRAGIQLLKVKMPSVIFKN